MVGVKVHDVSLNEANYKKTTLQVWYSEHAGKVYTHWLISGAGILAGNECPPVHLLDESMVKRR